MAKAPSPRKGGVYLLKPDPVLGAPAGKNRLCVVVQNDRDNWLRLVMIVAAISTGSASESLPFTVRLDAGTTDLSTGSFVNCGHLYTVSLGQLQGPIVELPSDKMVEVDRAILAILGVVAAEKSGTPKDRE